MTRRGMRASCPISGARITKRSSASSACSVYNRIWAGGVHTMMEISAWFAPIQVSTMATAQQSQRGRDMALMLFMAAPTLDQGSNILTSTFWIRIQFTFYISIWKHKIVAEVNLMQGTFDFSDALGLRGQPNPNGYPITCIKLISLSKMNSVLYVLTHESEHLQTLSPPKFFVHRGTQMADRFDLFWWESLCLATH